MRFLLSIIVFSLLFISGASCADFQKGLEAAQSGDFATTLREWLPLAEQGYVNAQQNLGEIYYNAQDYKEAGSEG